MVIGPLPHRVWPGRHIHPISLKGLGAHASSTVCLRSLRPGPAWQASRPSPRRREPVFPPGLRVGLGAAGRSEPECAFSRVRGHRAQCASSQFSICPSAPTTNSKPRPSTSSSKTLSSAKRESFPFESGIGFLISGTGHQNGVTRAPLVATGAGRRRICPKSDGADQRGGARKRAFGLFRCDHSQGTRKRHVPAGADPGAARRFCPSSSAIWPAFELCRSSPTGGVILADATPDNTGPQPFMIISVERGGPAEPADRGTFRA